MPDDSAQNPGNDNLSSNTADTGVSASPQAQGQPAAVPSISQDISPLQSGTETPKDPAPQTVTTETPVLNTAVPPAVAEVKPEVAPVAPPETVAPALVTTEPQRGKKLGRGKIIATILGAVLLSGGVAAGSILVNRQQNIRTSAGSCSQYVFSVTPGGEVTATNRSNKEQPMQEAVVSINGQPVSSFSVPNIPPGETIILGTTTVPKGPFSWTVTGSVECTNSGSYEVIGQSACSNNPARDLKAKVVDWSSDMATARVINLSSCEYHVGLAASMVINGKDNPYNNNATKIGAGEEVFINVLIPECSTKLSFFEGEADSGEELETVNINQKVVCQPIAQSRIPKANSAPSPKPKGEIKTKIGDVTAYNEDFKPLSGSDLAKLKPGDTVIFSVTGEAASGEFDSARFIINGDGDLPPVTEISNDTGGFYYEYTIPDGVESFEVKAALHHNILGWL